MKKENFCFKLKDTKSPDQVVREYANQVSQCTNNMVICEIKPYDGMITSYVKKSAWVEAVSAWGRTNEDTIDIQNDLGEQSEVENKYEVYLTVKGLEHYKYRIMFIRYGAISYPVSVVLNEDIAEAYSGKSQYEYEIESMDELKKLLEQIFDTEYSIKLIQSLIYEAMRQEAKNEV